MMTVPKCAVIRAYTPPEAPARNFCGFNTLVHSEPLLIEQKENKRTEVIKEVCKI